MSTPTLGGWLVHVMRRADGALSLEESLHVIMDSMKEFFPCQSVAVMLIDDDTKELRIKISRQISYTFVKKYRKAGPGPAAERIVLEQTPLLLASVDNQSTVYDEIKLEHDFASAVLAPIVKNQRGVGYMFCDRTAQDTPFDDTDLLHLQVIGYLIGQMMDKFELISERKKLSQIDDATKALQYKAFVPALGTEMERGRKHGYEVTVALLSVDAFRKYVDTYGIDQAHALLEEVVAVAGKRLNEMDLLARFSADAFVLYLSGKGARDAATALDALRSAIFDEVVGQGEASIEVTIGALTLPPTSTKRRSIQDVLGLLGKQLVEAKNRGGTAVVVSETD